jgi:hypothetical protein
MASKLQRDVNATARGRKVFFSVAERGVALASSMMALLLLTGMGLTIAMSAITETAVSANYRRNEQAFFAADAGIGLAREALRISLNQAILASANAAAPNITFPTSAGQDFNDAQLTNILTDPLLTSTNGTPIVNALAAVTARANALGGNGGFTVTIALAPVGLPILGLRPAAIGGIQQPPSSVTMRYAYTITATGNNNAAAGNPYRATAQASEQGVVNVTLNTTVNQSSTSNPFITRAFSSYAAFFNRFNQSSVLASGTFSGPVHTNERFRFSSSLPVTFKGAVTQSSSTGTYGYNSSNYAVNNTNRTGLTFQSTYDTVAAVPLPSNEYAQQLAVLNSTGLTDSTFTSPQPSTTQLVANLRTATNTAPGTTSGNLNNGVYVPSSNGTHITGGGIYVKGNADEITLSVTGTNTQVYAIRQGSTTTTVTIVPPSSSSAGTTTISNGSNSTTFQGVPLDKTDPNNIKPGASLFVQGNISSLHGPAATGSGSSRNTAPAIADKTGVTITSTGDITITGDLKYQQPVLNTDGTLATNGMSATNVLGIFTNQGRVTLTPSSTYTVANYSLTLDAAIATFNEPALTANSSATTGGIYYSCSSCSLNSSSRLLLRGSRIQSAILSIGYGGSSGGTRDVFFDPRFANGAFAPPFFPVTQLANNNSTTTTFSVSLATSNVASESNTWQRIVN